MKLVNLTPHAITVRKDGKDTTIPASGSVARLETVSDPATWDSEFPLVNTRVGKIVNLPSPELYTFFIVSMPVAQAVQQRDDVVAPDTGDSCIREAGKIVAITRFTRYL